MVNGRSSGYFGMVKKSIMEVNVFRILIPKIILFMKSHKKIKLC